MADPSAESAPPMPVFVVVEGIDGSGKSTLVERLCEHSPYNSVKWEFPVRDDELLGPIIDAVLKKEIQMTPCGLALLFAAQRHEAEAALRAYMDKGFNVMCGRYCYSGWVYAAARKGKEWAEWARSLDRGILEPDVVILLRCDPLITAQRKRAHEELFDRIPFQRRIAELFDALAAQANETEGGPEWIVIDTQDKTPEQVEREARNHIERVRTNLR